MIELHTPHYVMIEYTFAYCFFSSQNLYESIKNEPFKIPEDDGNDLTHTFFNPDREGWLLKLGLYIFLSAWLSVHLPSFFHLKPTSFPDFIIDWI